MQNAWIMFIVQSNLNTVSGTPPTTFCSQHNPNNGNFVGSDPEVFGSFVPNDKLSPENSQVQRRDRTVQMYLRQPHYVLLVTGGESLLNVSTVRRLFPLRTLTADAEDLYGYGHSKIGMAGTITFAVRYGTKALPAFTFQVSHQGANLMGFDLFCELGFTLVDNSGAAILSVGSPWHQRWPALFSGLGCLTAFDHQPLLKPEVHPVIQPIRRLPLALRDDVTAELQKLLDAGIIERIDASPENVVADLLSRATPTPAPARARTQPSQSSYSCSMPRFRPRFPWRTFGSRRRRTPRSPCSALTSGRDGLRSSRRSWRLFIGSRTS
ncbi:hypothetical protein F7725_001793 [Dissostichus mawsoni]|uniref:Uncharacterized protein n=1 Tax=Dissostichus mawsoni TaxID=36200 RepID=A0A7J5Y0K6_DISMA|nr:hypothetical protein F7725_001793 [Dissostichus mawsoni]